jgi:WD40-like Beta Propeller Repeat
VQSTTPTPTVRNTPRVTQVGRLLGVTGDWDLFALSANEIIRIQPGLGRVTRTPYPGLQSTGAIAFLPVRDRVLIRPWDNLPGYVVPDGSAAGRLSGTLSQGGRVFPGPNGDRVWVQATPDSRSLVLVRSDGTPTGTTIQLPPAAQWPTAADGSGHVLANGIGGVYLARSGGVRRITRGSVLAAGPTGWLAVECDERARCVRVVIDRATGGRRTLPGVPTATEPSTGTLAPDGSVAAYVEQEGEQPVVHLVDLGTGADHALTVDFDPETLDSDPAWSPDGRWLFLVSEGHVIAVDPRTRIARELGVDLPTIMRVAVRAR